MSGQAYELWQRIDRTDGRRDAYGWMVWKVGPIGNEAAGPNIVAVCAPCHDLIHRSGKRAYEMGWLVKSWDDPATVPLLSERRRAA